MNIQKESRINVDLVQKKLVNFIRRKVTAAGFSRVVVGISGGVDSATVAYLCAEALGNLSVLGVMMPYKKAADKKTLDFDKLLVGELKIRSEVIDIAPMIDAYFRNIPRADKIRRGNKMARERMTILYDKAKEFNGLVVGTGNKTELLLGYCTRYGDAACDLNPLAGLYKMQVYQLAEKLGVPEPIINRAPSAGLWPGQTDEGELGMTYKEIDRLFHYMVDKKFSTARLIKVGFKKKFIDKAKSRMSANEYKRRLPLMPGGVK